MAENSAGGAPHTAPGGRWRIVIAGLGMIGASLGLDLSRAGHEVLGMDLDAGHLQEAISLGAVDAAVQGDAPEADIVILAATPAANIELLEVPWRARLVIDTTSVKAAIAEAADAAGLPFVGGHPLAGTAGGGPGAAQTGLFLGRAFVLTWGRGPMDLARALVESVGARPVEMDAAAHDRALARSSHLVYLMSCALAGILEEYPPDLLGPAAFEMLRVATSPTGLWDQILAMNGAEVQAAARDLTAEIGRLTMPAGRDLQEKRRIALEIRRNWNDAH